MIATAQELENRINEKLALDNQVLGKGVAEKLFNEMKAEEATDRLVDQLLKSIGQSLAGNKKFCEENQKKVIDVDGAYQLLKKINEEV